MKLVITGPDNSRGSAGSMQHDINYVRGLDGVEGSLDWIARAIERLTSGKHSIDVSTAYPIELTLALNDGHDTLARFLTAWERIADALARIAGLSRPRLELWHEQDEYTPRYKEIACDGGAPGPKKNATEADNSQSPR